MGKAFEKIKTGLEEAIEFARGNTQGSRVQHVSVLWKNPIISPVKLG